MIDEMEHLRSDPDLFGLLDHYARLAEAEADREAWHDRLSHLEGVEPRQIVKLYGELIAFAWVEQNTGGTTACYRATLAGWRAVQQVQGGQTPKVLANPRPRFPRKKRAKSDGGIPVGTSSNIP